MYPEGDLPMESCLGVGNPGDPRIRGDRADTIFGDGDVGDVGD